MNISDSNILKFVKDNFSPNRSLLIKNLRQFDYSNGSYNKLSESLELIERPFEGFTGQIEANIENVNSSEPNLKEIGDISDAYIILLNEELNSSNFDIEDEHEGADYEYHFLKLWVNWLIPVYSVQVIYDRYCEERKRLVIGQYESLSKFEHSVVEKVKNLVEELGYHEISESILSQKIPETQTDCSDEDGATVFECLFSDANTNYPFRMSQNIQPLEDKEDLNSYFEPVTGQTYVIIRQTFDSKGDIIEKEEIDLVKNTGSIV